MGRHLALAIALALSLATGSGMAPAQRASTTATVSAMVIAATEIVVPVVPVVPPDSASGVAMFVSGLTGDLRIRLPSAAAPGKDEAAMDEAAVRAALAALHAERKGTCVRRNGRQAMQLGSTEKGLLEGNPVSCLGLDIPAPDAANFDSVNLIITYN